MRAERTALTAPRSAVEAFGAWLYPSTAYRRKSEPEVRLQGRAGLIGLVCTLSFGSALLAAIWEAVTTSPGSSPGSTVDPIAFSAAVLLVIISVFAPQAVFRTRSAADTREVLANPSTPIRSWRSTTISFDAVLVGGMLAGLYYPANLMLTFFGLALLARLVFTTERNLRTDPNARFHGIVQTWSSAVTALVAYLIVSPLAMAVSVRNAVVPLVLAALVALYVSLLFNSIERWITATGVPWAFARDAVDIRRIVVALVSAGLAWMVSVSSDLAAELMPPQAEIYRMLAGLGTFVAGWLALWYASILMWRRDALRTMAMWSAHQAQIVVRLMEGSLSPELAGRASLNTTARMAISVFAATRAIAVVEAKGQVRSQFLAVDRYEHGPQLDASSLAAHPHLHLPCWPVPGRANGSAVTIASWLWPGWFLTRSRGIVDHFTELATSALMLPVIAAREESRASAFGQMFDRVHRWPTVAAFEQAVDTMRARVDASPQSDSLVVGVLEIDDFGALSGGRFEQAAVAQVMRLALGFSDFAGRDLFVAYEAPGRIWLALAGGPIIRTSIGLMRGLQERINDHGSIPSAMLDVDVHVSVSMGYGAHQVDDFTREGLMASALNRLSIDAHARRPFASEVITFDIRPEDIIGEPEAPVTAVDLLHQLNTDSNEDPDAFPTRVQPIIDADSGMTTALLLSVGWKHRIGTVDLADPSAFSALVNRQPELAAEAARIILRKVVRAIEEADTANRGDLLILTPVPEILLHPETGTLALPNLAVPALDRRQCSRWVALVDTVPADGGQALRLLADRGIRIALTAAAASGIDQPDLFGWSRWAVVFPRQLLQSPDGVDSLTIQQTVSAIASPDTILIGEVDEAADARGLAGSNIRWIVDPDTSFDSARASIEAVAGSR